MRFSVLGPLDIEDDKGDRVALVGSKQRMLAAALLCNPNQMQSADRLIDQLWPAGPPRSAWNGLQVYIYRLRRALGDTGRLLRSDLGYTLVVHPAELDAHRFENLAADGRRAGADGHPAKAAELFREALALWRGEPFAGLDGVDAVREEASRLTELRLTTMEHQIDAELALGHHADVVGELTQLTSRHPLRAQFLGQLMTALYRSGRPADALRVYRTGRELLVAELGLEPGPELRELEQAILREDRDLALPDGRPAARMAAPPRPAQLPPPHGSTFSGRHAEFGRLCDLLRGNSSTSTAVAAISGVGGIGKSTLANQVAHAIADAYPDGQLYVNLHGSTPGCDPLAPADVLDRFSRALGGTGDTSASAEEASARFRTLTSGLRLLIVLDNAVDAVQLRLLVPGGPGCAVLITSRDTLAAMDGSTHLHLDTLSESESVELLERLVGGQRVRAEPDAARVIARLCGGLPLALRIAGARLLARPRWTLEMLAGRLGQARRRLDELEYADLAVRASFAVSLDQLRRDRTAADPDPGQLFELLGLLDGPDIATPVAAALADRPVEVVGSTLDLLVDGQLLRSPSADRYTMHDLIRLHARELAAAHLDLTERDAAVRRALHWYLASVRSAASVLVYDSGSRLAHGLPQTELICPGLEFSDRLEASGWLDLETPNLLAATRQALATSGDGTAIGVGLAAALNALGPIRHLWRELLPVNESILRAVLGSGDTATMALAHSDVGRASRRLGRLDAAVGHFRQALAGWRKVGDRVNEASTLYSLGAIGSVTGRFGAAFRYYHRALRIRRDTGDRYGEAQMLNVLGTTSMARDRLDEALDHYESALLIFRELDDGEDEGMVLGNLAELYRRRGDLDRAMPLFSRALDLLRAAGDRMGEAEVLWNLGRALNARDQPRQARSHWTDSLAVLKDMRALTAEEADDILRSPTPDIPAPIRLVR